MFAYRSRAESNSFAPKFRFKLTSAIVILVLYFSNNEGVTVSATTGFSTINNYQNRLALDKTPASKKSSPIAFIQNVGQFDKKALYQVSGNDGTIYLTEDAIWFTYLEPVQYNPKSDPHDQGSSEAKDLARQKARKAVNLKVFFPGSNPHSTIQPFGKIDSNISYFGGRDSSAWQTNVPAWSRACYGLS